MNLRKVETISRVGLRASVFKTSWTRAILALRCFPGFANVPSTSRLSVKNHISPYLIRFCGGSAVARKTQMASGLQKGLAG